MAFSRLGWGGKGRRWFLGLFSSSSSHFFWHCGMWIGKLRCVIHVRVCFLNVFVEFFSFTSSAWEWWPLGAIFAATKVAHEHAWPITRPGSRPWLHIFRFLLSHSSQLRRNSEKCPTPQSGPLSPITCTCSEKNEKHLSYCVHSTAVDIPRRICMNLDQRNKSRRLLKLHHIDNCEIDV